MSDDPMDPARSAALMATLGRVPTPSRVATGAEGAVLFRYSALTFNGHRIHYDLD